MKPHIKGLLTAVILLVSIGLAAIATVERFQCVDCTETQLFLNKWPLYLCGLFIVLAASCLQSWGTK